MKMSKGQGISLFSAIIIFGIFNIVVFLAPLAHTVVFWLGYFFALFALVTMALTLVLYFGKEIKEDKFLSLPTVKTAWIYFVLQTALSVWEMTAFPLSYLPALVINLITGIIFAGIILSLYAASGKIDKSEQFTAEKVVFIKQLKFRLDTAETNDAILAAKIKDLAEDVRFSDPMSHSKLAEIEDELNAAVDALVAGTSDTEKAMAICEQANKLLKKRNELCKMYKGVKDTQAAQAKKSNNGLGIAFAGVCAMLAMFLITFVVCFIVVPQAKYNEAESLLNAEKFAEASAAFAALKGYRDSEEKQEEIRVLLLENDYNAALALMSAEKYDEASAAFAALGDYRDSKEKCEEIRTAQLDNKYNEAEKLFNAGKYAEAVNLYSALRGYKDSKLRMEQIANRLGKGDILYFGTGNAQPVAWQILKTENGKMLLLAKNVVAQKPFSDDIKTINWETSSLRTWLNEEFINCFSAEQQEQILLTDTGDTKDKIFLLSADEIAGLEKNADLSVGTQWWTRTHTESGMLYVTANGQISADGEQTIREQGVRPAMWISLQ